MVHWWDYWSPGIQAVGGAIELLGLWHLVREWVFSMMEPEARSLLKKAPTDERLKLIRQVDDAFTNLSKVLKERGIDFSPAWLPHLQLKRASLDEKVELLEADKTDLNKVIEKFPDIRRRRYYIGVFFVALGALTQIVANAISFLGNMDLL